MKQAATAPFRSVLPTSTGPSQQTLTDQWITLAQIETCAYVVTDVEHEMRFGKAVFNKFKARRQEMRPCHDDLLLIGWPDGKVIEVEVLRGEPPFTARQFVELYIGCFSSIQFES